MADSAPLSLPPRRNSPLQEAVNRLQENDFASLEDRLAYLRGLEPVILANILVGKDFYDDQIQEALREFQREQGDVVQEPGLVIPKNVEAGLASTAAASTQPLAGGRRSRHTRRSSRKPKRRARTIHRKQLRNVRNTHTKR